MLSTTLSFANLHAHGTLFADTLRARGDGGADAYSWDLPHLAADSGYDQYDTPVSRWVAVHDDAGRVLAGARLTPTTAKAGVYSYMIRDAQAGLIHAVPTDLLFQTAPVSDDIWELTRGFVATDLTGEMRRGANDQLLAQILRTARQEGIARLIGILPQTWERWAQQNGVQCVPAGRQLTLDGLAYQAVWMEADGKLH